MQGDTGRIRPTLGIPRPEQTRIGAPNRHRDRVLNTIRCRPARRLPPRRDPFRQSGSTRLRRPALSAFPARIARRAGACRRAGTRSETTTRPNSSRSLSISTGRPGLRRRSPAGDKTWRRRVPSAARSGSDHRHHPDRRRDRGRGPSSEIRRRKLLLAFGPHSTGSTVTYSFSASMVFGPMPCTPSRSSTDVNGRASTMAAARTSPIPLPLRAPPRAVRPVG